ncbi:MAG TPA: MarR family winged helix-turn-helix transcriptional regulator [Labilithrix sp.]|nr:MarR family winged helix-turn-helix transcriptional regulator [Labilithrix sp.]
MTDLLGNTPRLRELNRALEALHFAFRAVTSGPDAMLAEYGLSRVHHRILYFIAKTPGLRVNELLATLGVTKQAMNAPLRELTDRGLVAESVDEADRRGKRLRLTGAGLALEQRLSGHQRDLFARVFRKVGRGKEEAWFEVMSLLAASPVTSSPHASRKNAMTSSPAAIVGSPTRSISVVRSATRRTDGAGGSRARRRVGG